MSDREELADRLLSDEAVESAANHLAEHSYLFEFDIVRAALQAAIDAVTKEDGSE